MKRQCDRISSCDITRERSRVSVCDPPYRGSHARGHTVCPAAGGHTGAAGRVSRGKEKGRRGRSYCLRPPSLSQGLYGSSSTGLVATQYPSAPAIAAIEVKNNSSTVRASAPFPRNLPAKNATKSVRPSFRALSVSRVTIAAKNHIPTPSIFLSRSQSTPTNGLPYHVSDLAPLGLSPGYSRASEEAS